MCCDEELKHKGFLQLAKPRTEGADPSFVARASQSSKRCAQPRRQPAILTGFKNNPCGAPFPYSPWERNLFLMCL